MTAGGIARLAGVGRAAVSNWRRRHADFPKPVGGTDASPSFDLAEVEQWLRGQGKLGSVPLRERVWQQVEQSPDGATAALLRIGPVLLLISEQSEQSEQSEPGQGAVGFGDSTREAGLPAALGTVLQRRLGEGHPVPLSTATDLAVHRSLLHGAAELAAELGPRQAFEFLMGRHMEAGPRQYTITPAEPAELMAELAGGTELVFDPACGFGGLLRAAGPSVAVAGQEVDPDLAALTALRLALHSDGPVRIRVGDSLRADAFAGGGGAEVAGRAGVGADAVLCHPPFNERSWGHDELAYDARWEYGFPPRTESELAWVQHALAHTREGGTAVLLMPPAAAARRSGRRIRADLLRRGGLRAVIALPAGVAPPFGIPLHLWILRRPGKGQPQSQKLLLVDIGALPETRDRERPSWQMLRTAVLEAWTAFDRDGTVPERPGVSRALPVIDLLDDDVDLTPARHLPQQAVDGGATGLAEVRARLTDAVRRTAELTPLTEGRGASARRTLTSVGELARAGALLIRTGGGTGLGQGLGTGGGQGLGTGGGQGLGTGRGGTVRPAVLTEHDVIGGGPATGVLPGVSGADTDAEADTEPAVLVEIGDVVVPVLGRGAVARVIDETHAGAVLGRNVQLLRPDPGALDPWFLAGFLRGTVNNRQASSFTSTATRLDVRRLQLPRLPLAEQQRYGRRFHDLAAFEDALRLTARLGEQLVQGLYDGLTDGSVGPE